MYFKRAAFRSTRGFFPMFAVKAGQGPGSKSHNIVPTEWPLPMTGSSGVIDSRVAHTEPSAIPPAYFQVFHLVTGSRRSFSFWVSAPVSHDSLYSPVSSVLSS